MPSCDTVAPHGREGTVRPREGTNGDDWSVVVHARSDHLARVSRAAPFRGSAGQHIDRENVVLTFHVHALRARDGVQTLAAAVEIPDVIPSVTAT
jgi:hypothetical protein